MGEGPDHGEPELFARKAQAELRQLGRKSATPRRWREAVADLDAPAGIEGIIVETAKADDPPVQLGAHGPRAIAELPLLAGMAGDMPAASPDIRDPMGVAHRSGIAEKRQQLRRVGKARRRQPEAARFQS